MANKFTPEQIEAVNPKDPKVKWRLWRELTDEEKEIRRQHLPKIQIIDAQKGWFKFSIDPCFGGAQYEFREFKPSDFKIEEE